MLVETTVKLFSSNKNKQKQNLNPPSTKTHRTKKNRAALENTHKLIRWQGCTVKQVHGRPVVLGASWIQIPDWSLSPCRFHVLLHACILPGTAAWSHSPKTMAVRSISSWIVLRCACVCAWRPVCLCVVLGNLSRMCAASCSMTAGTDSGRMNGLFDKVRHTKSVPWFSFRLSAWESRGISCSWRQTLLRITNPFEIWCLKATGYLQPGAAAFYLRCVAGLVSSTGFTISNWSLATHDCSCRNTPPIRESIVFVHCYK